MPIDEVIKIIAIGSWVLLGLFFVVRDFQVYRIRMHLLKEEDEWLDSHMELFVKYMHFRRYDVLPNYWKMVFQFWKPIDKFREEVKPVESYYIE